MRKIETAWMVNGKKRYFVGAAAALIILMILAACSLNVVPAGSVGVYVLFGKVGKTPYEEGLYLINPFASIERMSTRTQAYTMSVVAGEGSRNRDDSIVALSRDGLKVSLDVTVLYRLNRSHAVDMFQNVGIDYAEKVIRPSIRASIRDVAAQFTATELYSEARERLTSVVEKNLRESLGARGILCEQVLLRNMELPPSVQQAINEKLAAEQESQKMAYLIQREKQEAERRRQEAQGIADANKTIQTSLSPEYLQWYYIERLKDVVKGNNNTVVILPFDQNLVPLLNIGEKRK